ncbi:P-loop containing nucleoside triphosphate hydrolase [Pseudocohnilembus persalinus]|uniref:p-loop containing nucleoside triphosphate hydrolase n=1 Tax=Pseudocohnilembus persalinus TaxID=266149 RepID=A0A0V0R517_PSEPJ|nr:P-loop containing nucleoside triphosphate hydrolase [Pseudocohnilembus persalinus]|eukprot:KRX09561.1 P-loop containing nucleoside triphosphate hydrolase [Pseudocohnilembus persalinus]
MPPLTISRIFYLTGYSCSLFGCFSSIFHLPYELQMCLIQLYTAGTLYLIFGIYLQEVLPKDFGLQKKPLFFLEKYKHLFKKKPNLKLLSEIHDKDQNSFQQNPDSIDNINAKLNNQQNIVDVQNLSDPGIIEEIQKIEHIFDYKQFAMVTKNLKKTYKPVGGRKQHTAVKDFYLSVERGEIFGLLGPNGAGKTTLISMLTGALPPTQGDAWIGGFNIQTQQDQIHSIIGVCPQFDLLWSNLTIYEHLEFYARLKGISEVQIPYQIDTVLKEVKLFNFKNKLAKSLSGGMRRRLSVAISLIGNPHIIFLDEPSTGLDPDNRRQMWEILSHNKGKRAMILTTHSMEEADVLCQRIGIVTQGQLRCVGSQQRLKTVYGQGFHIEINCRKEKYFEQKLYQENSNLSLNEIQKQALQLAKQNQKFCKQKLYQNIKNLYEVQDFNGNMIFQVPREGTSISHIYKLLKQNKDDWFIEDYGISQSSLEDVFLEVVQKDY